MSAFVRGTPPPDASARPPVYTIIAPRAGEVVDLSILDERVLGLRCHWVIDPKTKKGRSRVCYGDTIDECPWCVARDREYWLGFLAVACHGKRTRNVLRMCAQSTKNALALATRYNNLRGLRVEVTRGNHDKAALSFKLSQHPPLQPVPQAHDIEATVCMVLDCDHIPDLRFGKEDKEVIPCA